jgi:PTH2 family peptidyl-tRNA hydrolase
MKNKNSVSSHEYKQCIVVRGDLELSTGKLCVQVAHASVLSCEKSNTKDRRRWMDSGGKKVVLQVENEKALLRLKENASRMKLPNALVVDAGLTEVPPGTVTALGIGPAKSGDIDKITGNLGLL